MISRHDEYVKYIKLPKLTAYFSYKIYPHTVAMGENPFISMTPVECVIKRFFFNFLHIYVFIIIHFFFSDINDLMGNFYMCMEKQIEMNLFIEIG